MPEMKEAIIKDKVIKETVIRDAVIEDAKRILEIYDHYIKNTAITFECKTPSLDDFKNRIRRIMLTHPYIVIEENNIIEGYAYAGVINDRSAYRFSAELSIYIDKNSQKKGYGRILYEEMQKRLKQKGILNVYAKVAWPDTEDEFLNNNSLKFHEHMGFEQVGAMHKCGYKFNRWYNIAIMEKMLGDHKTI